MSNKRHALKVLSLAVMAALAIGAFAVSSASAATWKVAGTSLGNGEERNVTAQLKTGTTATLKGTLLGQQFELTATELASAGWGGVGSATIKQEGTSAKAIGRLSLSGLTVDKPAGCTVTSPIVMKDLTAEVVAHGEAANAYVKFFPEEGTTFATIIVKGCAVAGSYPVKGTFYGEGNKFGEEQVNQKLNFSPAINTTLGGALTLGTNAATLTAEGTNHLASGQKFGAHMAAFGPTWKVEGTSLGNGEERNVTAQLKTGTTATLKGTLLGQQFELTATELSSAGWGGVGSATIEQESTKAKAKGRLSLSGLTVDKPAGCTFTSPIVMKDLTAEVVSHGESETAYVKVFPEEGETFATFVVKGCALAGSYPLKGTFYGEGNKFGEELVNQKLDFSPTINTTLGGALMMGTSAATLTAEVTSHLESGQKFGAVK